MVITSRPVHLKAHRSIGPLARARDITHKYFNDDYILKTTSAEALASRNRMGEITGCCGIAIGIGIGNPGSRYPSIPAAQ